MFDKLGQLKDLRKLKGQMEELKKRLDNMVIKTDSPRHLVEITMNGSMEVKEVRVDALAKNFSEEELAKDIQDAFNKAVRDTQTMAAQVMGGFGGLPQA